MNINQSLKTIDLDTKIKLRTICCYNLKIGIGKLRNLGK